MPSQQSSLSGTRTALMPQDLIVVTRAWSWGPSKKPQPWEQAYSVPALLTACRTGRVPIVGPVVGLVDGLEVGVLVGEAVLVGAGVLVGAAPTGSWKAAAMSGAVA